MPAKWLNRYGPCGHAGCTRPSVGVLMDERNSRIGERCEKHAAQDLALAKAAREAR